jgi:hypothetical protein
MRVSHWSIVAKKVINVVQKGVQTRKYTNAKFIFLTSIMILAVKFGAKIIESGLTIAGKAMSAIPAFRGVGKVVGGTALVFGKISSAVKTTLPKKMQHGMDIMDTGLKDMNKYTKFL